MHVLFALVLAFHASEPPVPGGEVTLSIERDWQSSSDHVTLCRVRATNYGPRSWAGRSIAFEARALSGSEVVARERGRFGLVLAPYGTLETLIGFHGRFDRFEVVPLRGARDSSGNPGTARGRKKGKKARG